MDAKTVGVLATTVMFAVAGCEGKNQRAAQTSEPSVVQASAPTQAELLLESNFAHLITERQILSARGLVDDIEKPASEQVVTQLLSEFVGSNRKNFIYLTAVNKSGTGTGAAQDNFRPELVPSVAKALRSAFLSCERSEKFRSDPLTLPDNRPAFVIAVPLKDMSGNFTGMLAAVVSPDEAQRQSFAVDHDNLIQTVAPDKEQQAATVIPSDPRTADFAKVHPQGPDWGNDRWHVGESLEQFNRDYPVSNKVICGQNTPNLYSCSFTKAYSLTFSLFDEHPTDIEFFFSQTASGWHLYFAAMSFHPVNNVDAFVSKLTSTYNLHKPEGVFDDSVLASECPWAAKTKLISYRDLRTNSNLLTVGDLGKLKGEGNSYDVEFYCRPLYLQQVASRPPNTNWLKNLTQEDLVPR